MIAIGAEGGEDARPRVNVFNVETGALVTSFSVYNASFRGGVRVAVADLNNDGNAEIITAPGSGRSGLVKVFASYGFELPQYRIGSYETSFTGGVYVAAADVDGDGYTDIITTPAVGRNVEVRVWRNRLNKGETFADDVFANSAYHKFAAFGGQRGATVAAGDLTGDGRAEIVVGRGPGSAPLVRVFDLARFAQGEGISAGTSKSLVEIKPFGKDDRGGVFVALGNVRGSSTPEIIVGNGRGGRAAVQLFGADGRRFKTFNAFDRTVDNAEIHIAVKNVNGNLPDGDAYDEILVAEGAPNSSHRLRAFEPDGALIDDVLQSEGSFLHGFFVA